MIRGGHLDTAMLGGMRVSAAGDLAVIDVDDGLVLREPAPGVVADEAVAATGAPLR